MSLTLNLEPIISAEVGKALESLKLDEKIDAALEIAVQKASKTITVDFKEVQTKMGVQHFQFEKILKLIAMGENLMIKGEAGNGKSHVVAEVAKALNLPFHSMSVSNQTTKTDLMGFVDANGVYRYNGFITAFRDGGVFNMDEIDAGNANVLVVLNSALSNGFVETPNGEMVYKHKDFRFVATANTTGRGATQKYVGRNKLDSATLDRFAVIEFGLDEDIELMLCGGDKNFHDAIKAMRVLCDKNYEELQISQRSSTRLHKILSDSSFTVREALDIAVFKGVDEDICKTLTSEFKKFFKAEHKKALEKNEKVEPEEVVVQPEEVVVQPEDDFEEITEDDVGDFEW